jgi:hypothetical protein
MTAKRVNQPPFIVFNVSLVPTGVGTEQRHTEVDPTAQLIFRNHVEHPQFPDDSYQPVAAANPPTGHGFGQPQEKGSMSNYLGDRRSIPDA